MDSVNKNKATSILMRGKKVRQVLDRVNQEMYLRNLELAETNRTLSLLRIIDKHVLEADNTLEQACYNICHEISSAASFPLVAIMASGHHTKKLKMVGFDTRIPLDEQAAKYVHQYELRTDEDVWFEHEQEPLQIGIEVLKKMHHPLVAPVRNQLLRLSETLGVKSLYIVQLRARQNLVGLMIVGLVSDGVNTQITHNDKELLDRIGGSTGVVLDNKLLLEENERVLNQLQRTNEKLKALDETKDEFISMASHQLRTPLTSVKGYVSMVLEGDAGQITEPQKELLNQAFTSSQRMVYLIADLLNVSRLRTGKFVIDNSPTNLAEVVEGEIAQLTEQAKTKKQTLSYKKPKHFPTLMLDETKIRQVIMNFADNALYYTPTGGHITVELKEDRSNVYFTVKDNGLGVPKEEQKHLFTKFFRAKNARQARPDGTGLGLFMAKKVVTAQGGTLLFESEEGKGSTFGFTFDKAKHLAKE